VSHLAGGSVRRSVKEMLVSYSSLTAVLQNLKNCGSKILSITPHQQPITNSQSSLKATMTELGDDELVQRLLARGRTDSNEAVIRHRLQVYRYGCH
jgi:hypothetical protein